MNRRDIYFSSERIDIERDIEKLRNEFSRYGSGDYFLPVNNFTSALHLAMCAVDLKRGDKVICSVNSSPEIPEIVRHFDAEPILVDIEPNSNRLSIKSLKEILNSVKSKKLRAIVVSHHGGEILNIEEIASLVKKRDLHIIEDGTESLGLDRSKIDNISDIRLFSLDTPISTLSLFVTDNENIFQRAELLSNHGIEFDRESKLGYIYDVVDIGCQYRASQNDISIGIEKLKKIRNDMEKRREIAKRYIDGLGSTKGIEVDRFNPNHTYSKFIIRVAKNRDGFAKELKEYGIETRLHYIPIHLLSYYKNKYQFRINSFPNALRNFQQVLSLPIRPELDSEDIDYVIATIQFVAKNRR